MLVTTVLAGLTDKAIRISQLRMTSNQRSDPREYWGNYNSSNSGGYPTNIVTPTWVKRISSEAALALFPEGSFSLWGKFGITVLAGTLDLMGAISEPSDVVLHVFAPTTAAPYYGITVQSADQATLQRAAAKYQQQPPSECRGLLLLVSHLEDSVASALEKYGGSDPHGQVLWTAPRGISRRSKSEDRAVLAALGCHVLSEPGIRPEPFEETISAITDFSVNSRRCAVLVAGPKDAGKSTFCRLLVNNLLNSWKQVAYLDCDLGQSEFAPCSTLSCVLVTQPLFDSPFTAHRSRYFPLRTIFFGDMSPGDDPDAYSRAIEECYHGYLGLLDPTPLVVNTMGWTTGLGLQLLVDQYHLAAPTHVVQLQAGGKQDLLPLTPAYIRSSPGWLYKAGRNRTNINHSLSIVESRSRDPNSVSPISLTPPQQRNLTTIGHLAATLPPSTSALEHLPYVRLPLTHFAVYLPGVNVPQRRYWDVLREAIVVLCWTTPRCHRRRRCFVKAAYVNNEVQCLVDDMAMSVAESHMDVETLLETEVNEPPIIVDSGHRVSCHVLGFGYISSVDVERSEVVVRTGISQAQLAQANTLAVGRVTIMPRAAAAIKEQDGEYRDQIPGGFARHTGEGRSGPRRPRQCWQQSPFKAL